MLHVYAGDLRDKIIIESPSRAPDGIGGYSREWVKVATVYGKVRPLTGTERTTSDRMEATGGYHIIIRHRRDLKESYTLVWNGRRHNIRWIKERTARDLYIELETEQGAAV